MADFSMTITNSLNFFAGGPASLWNAHNWNAFAWGEGSQTMPKSIIHLMPVDMVTTSTVGKQVLHLISENQSLSDDFPSTPYKFISESISLAGDLTDEELIDGSGYNYVFPDRATNAEDRDFTSYTSGTTATSGWTLVASAGGNWS